MQTDMQEEAPEHSKGRDNMDIIARPVVVDFVVMIGWRPDEQRAKSVDVRTCAHDT